MKDEKRKPADCFGGVSTTMSWFSIHPPRATALAAALCMVFQLSGCNAAQSNKPAGENSMTIKITCDAFAGGKPIPKKHTGEGQDVSPALHWSGSARGNQGTGARLRRSGRPDAPAMGSLGDLQDSRHGNRFGGRRLARSEAERSRRRPCRARTRGRRTISATRARCHRPAMARTITISSSTRSRRRWMSSPVWIRTHCSRR